MPIVYVSDMGRALDFYSAFGLESSAKDRSPMWTELSLGNAVLALHYANPLPDGHGRVELALVSDGAMRRWKRWSHGCGRSALRWNGRSGVNPSGAPFRCATPTACSSRSTNTTPPDADPIPNRCHQNLR
jgi:hypothetical protein